MPAITSRGAGCALCVDEAVHSCLVGEQGWIEREHLGEPLAVVPVLDCRVSFRRQLESNDLWSVVTGPLGTFAHNVLPEAVLRQVQREEQRVTRPATPRLETGPRAGSR
jgi:hypothetical protein